MSRGNVKWCQLVFLGLGLLGIGFLQAQEARPVVPQNWKTKVGDNVRWSRPDLNDTQWDTVPILGPWEEQGLMGVDGIVWFRQEMVLTQELIDLVDQGRLGLEIGPVRFGAVEVFANGQMIGRSKGWSQRLPLPAAEVFRFPADAVGKDGELLLALRVQRIGWASDHTVAGSLLGGVLGFGDFGILSRFHQVKELRSLVEDVHLLVLSMVYGLVAIYNALIFFYRRASREYLWFSAFSLCFAVNTLAISNWIFAYGSSYGVAIRLGDAAGHLASASAIMFFWTFFARSPSNLLRIYSASHLILGTLILVWPTVELVISTSLWRFLWLLPLLVVAVVVLGREAIQGDREARVMGLGALVLVFGELWQMGITSLGFPNPEPMDLPPFGFAAVVVSMAVALGMRFQRTHSQLDQLRINLERKVRERTQSLHQSNESLLQKQQELRDSQAQLVQTAKLASIGELAAGVAHELNQPLAVIRMRGQLLERKKKNRDFNPGELEELLGVIERNTSRMMKVISHLRTFSRETDTEHSEIFINEVIKSAFLMLHAQLREWGIVVQQDLDEDLAPIMGNAIRLEQVIVNLLTNARDAVKASARENKLILVKTYQDQTHQAVLIRDNGVGMDDCSLSRIFDPFFSTKPVGEGTGLGLSISYGIIKEHHGYIEVLESTSQGTTFKIALPAGLPRKP